jgi:hypothetical protein
VPSITGKIGRGLEGGFDDGIQAIEVAREAGGLLRDAGVARGAEDLGDPGRLLQLPDKCVFAAAAAQYEDFHGYSKAKRL